MAELTSGEEPPRGPGLPCPATGSAAEDVGLLMKFGCEAERSRHMKSPPTARLGSLHLGAPFNTRQLFWRRPVQNAALDLISTRKFLSGV